MRNNFLNIKRHTFFLLIAVTVSFNMAVSHATPPAIQKQAIPGNPAQEVTWPVIMKSNNALITAKIYQGLKGYAKQNSDWISIKVIVENAGPPTQITAKISYEAESFRQLRKIVSLEKGAKKVVTFHVLMTGNDFLNASLERNGKDISWSNVNLNRQPSLAGVLTNNSNGDYTALSKALSTKVVELSAFDLPEYGQELLALDTLIINNFNTSSLNKNQRSAISEWVASGGNLLIFGGPGWKENISGLANELLPVTPGGLTAADLKYTSSGGGRRTVGRVAIASARLAEGSTSILGDSNDTVIANRAVGSGNVHWIGFDTSVLTNNADVLDLIKTNKAINLTNNKEFELLSYYPINELLSRATSKSFSLSWITIVMLLYLAVVGPVNYLVLKKYDKKELAWLTIPAIVLIFSVGMYSTSRFQRGSVSALNQVNIVELLDQEKGIASVNTTANVFSATKQEADLSVKGRYLMTDFRPGYYYSSNNYVDFNDDNPDVSMLQNIELPFWASRRFYFSGIQNNENLRIINSGIIPELAVNKKLVLSGSIKNMTKNKIDPVFIWLKPYVYYTGEIGPGQTGKIVGKEKVWSQRRNHSGAKHIKGSDGGEHRVEITSLLLSSLEGLPKPAPQKAGAIKGLNDMPLLFTWNDNLDDFQLLFSGKKIKGFNDTLLIKILDASMIKGLHDK